MKLCLQLMSISPKAKISGHAVGTAIGAQSVTILRVDCRMSDRNTHSGLAALSICEALLLALKDAHILPESEIRGLLSDAAATHENAAALEVDREQHKAAAALINRIIAGRQSGR